MEKKQSLLSLITTSNLVFFVIFFLLIDLQRNSFVSTTAIDTGIPLIDIRSNETSSVDIINLTSGGSGDHSKGVLPKVYEDGNSIFSLGTYEFGELGINNLMDNTPLVPYLLDNSFFEKIRVKDIVLNNLQTTFLSDSGDVYSIGKNKFGQFGDGTTSESFNYNPTLLQLNEKVIKVVLGTSHMLLLTITGVVYGVGDNSGNQLIPNGAANYLLPVKIFDTSYSIKDIQAGEQFSLGISNTGSIYSLGKNVIISTYTGRVPAPQPTLIPTPPIPIPSAPTPLPTSPIVPIASTIPTVTAYTITNIDIDYEDRYNSLNFDIPEPTPVTSFAPILVVEGKKPIRIWTGKLCVLVETDTQEFFLNGQLGEFKSTERFVSISIISGIVNWKNFTDVRFSQNSILLLTDSLVVYEVIYGDSFSLYERVGNVKVFGELKVTKTTDGQNVYEKDVSSGLYTKKLSLKNLKPNIEITKIVMASKFDGLSLTYYLTSDNSIYFSIKHPNDNNNARATSFGFSPMNITYNINGLLPSTLRFIKPSKGNTFSIFVDNSNNIYSSGSIDGSVGLTMTQILSTELPAGDMITDISVGESHTLILTTKQLVFAFGNNDNTQFCTATGAGDPKTTLTKVGLSNVIAIAAGNGFSLFVISAPESTTGTQVYVCGNSGLKENTGGFLDFFDGKNITSIVGAYQHSFFLSSSGSVYAVGTNTKNVLGIEGVEADSTTTIPTEVGLKGEKIVKVSSVYETALFLTEKGEVYASGAISNETLSSTPRKIMNGLEGKVIVDIGVGLDFGLLLTSNGELYGIRYNTINYYGQLGAGLDPMSFIPIRIPIYNKVKNMEVGYSHSFLTISNAEPLCDKIANCSGHVNNCSNHGTCISTNQCPNQCKCNEGYDSYDCKFSKLFDTDMDISGKIEGIEKITKFSLVVIVNNTKVDPSNIYYNYFIVNIMNITSINPKIEFTMKNKGNYELFITIYSKERTDYIFGKLKRNIIVSEFKENTITTLNLNDIYEITQNNNDLYNNENKTSIVQQVISSIKKEIIQTSDQGEKVLEIYKSVATHAEIPVSVNITSQINQISNIMLESKKNSSITDSQVDVTINNIVFILDNILQQTNSSLNTTDAPTSVLRKDTESTIQTSLSLLSISSSILQKRVEGKTMNLLFKRIENNNNVTNLNFANEYQFNVPNDVNNNAKDNISYGVVKINSDSQLYSTSEMKLSNILQLKTFINGSYVPLKNLIQPIRISFKLEKKNVSFNNSINYSCKYFNESSQEWKSDGCQNVGTTIYTDYIVMNCECDHTTSFLTFLEFSNPIKSNNQTSIAQIVLSSIYLVIIIVIFIGLLIFTKLNEPIIKSRFLTPYLGLTAIFIDNLFSGIISNSIFQQTKLFPTTNSPTYDSAADIVGNVAIIISTMMTLIAISNYCIECIRYLLIRYLYELLNNNDLNVEKGYLFKIFTSKLIYIITNLVIGISIIIYFVIFVILRRFNVISSYAFSCVTSITYFLLILSFSIIILTIYIIDIYFTKKYKQFSNEMIDIIKNTEPSSQEKNPKDEKKKINLTVKNYQHFIYNFFIINDTLQFRLEACIYFLGLTFFIISFSIGFYLLSLKESTASKVEPSTAILIFDLIRTITWIMLFGGYILIILISKKNFNYVNKNATKKIEEENNEFNFSFIFKRKEIFTLFKQFSKQEFSLENVYAFIDLEKIKEEAKQNNSMIWNEFEKFKTKYLDNYATMELNISFEVKRQVNEYLKERNNVNDLIQCIENALYINLGDTYSRFIETNEYLFIENCNELQEKLKN
ncbi:hypothetical protein ABK040_006584 [Willaertia magna]